MNKQINLNNKGLSFHFVGILGIGMSGLAQFLRWKGFEVSGSDRAVHFPANEMLHATLTKLGVKLYKQDGSYIYDKKPDYIVFSTAIEEDNPDFKVSGNIPRLHRTELLVELFDSLKDKTSIAVAGTCGKTTVSSLIAETFEHLGLDPFALIGGFVNSFTTSTTPGNFKPGNGKWMIFESDESDKSLLRFYPDYSILLNLGTDHYSKEELKIVFEKFLRNTRKGVVIERKLYKLLNPESYKHLKIVVFSDNSNMSPCEDVWYYNNYNINKNIISVEFCRGNSCKHVIMPVPGRYNAGNFLAVFALYELLNLEKDLSENIYLAAMNKFKGVHRRFEHSGLTSSNAHVYCDFAHNVNKIESALNCAKELSEGKVFAIFQPHGYKPFRFMKDELFPAIENSLGENDKFILLPVFYSGGTCIPEPKVEDVTKEFAGMSKVPEKFTCFLTRKELEYFLKKEVEQNDIILIMGARDNSLPIWAKELSNTL